MAVTGRMQVLLLVIAGTGESWSRNVSVGTGGSKFKSKTTRKHVENVNLCQG